MVGLLLLGTLTQAQTTLLTLKSCQQTGTSYTWTNNTGSAVTLRITAQGGGGGNAYVMNTVSTLVMGSTGATVKGDFVVQPGHTLMFVAGGKGENAKLSQIDYDGGGGGGGAGSGVVNLSTNTVLMIAAGGTGATGTSVNDIGLGGSGATDGNGSGGGSGADLSTGGGGLNGNGVVGRSDNECTRGGGQVSLIGISVGGAQCTKYLSSGRGGSGMGGGGGASDVAGGGGGHTGGNGGNRSYGPYSRAKSYNSGTNPVNTNGSDGVEPNDGQVLVEVLSGNPAPITQPGSVHSATHPIVSISHPSSCKGMDGSISLTGLVINTTYSVTYKKDNGATTTVEVTSNNNGVITLSNLGAGNYTQIVATEGGCASNAVSASLADPIRPSITLGNISTICEGAMSFSIPYTNPTQSPQKYSIEGLDITPVTDGSLSNPITVNLSNAASGSSIPFTLTVKNTTTNCESSNIMGMVVVQKNAGGTVSSAQTICSGTSPLDLSLSGQTQTGSVVKWQKSSDANFGNSVDIASTATTLPSATIGTLTADTYFRAVVQNGMCSANSSSVKITVNPVSVGGTVSSAQTICSGTSPLSLSLSGQTGSVVKWQKASDANFSTPVDIASTATTLPSGTIGSLTADTYFRAVVKSGVCSEAISSTVKITINSVSVGGTVSSAQTICSGTSPLDISLSGQTGSVVKWQKSSDVNFSNAVDIASTAMLTTLPSATIGALTTDTYFRAVVKSGVCSEAISSSVKITINSVSVGGVVSSAQTICSGTAPADLSLSGQVGNVVRWEKSTNSSFSSRSIISSTSTTLTSAIIGLLTTDTYFRAIVKSGECAEATSSIVLIRVNSLPTATISGTTAVCQNSPKPKITFTGANGTAPYTFTYSFKETEKTVTTESGNSVSVEVPTNEVGTFEYSLVSVKDASTTTCSQTQSGSATVTVNPLPTATISGTTAVCQNSPKPKITFTGANGTAPYTFTYILKGIEKTVTTENGNSVSVEAPTNEAGTFEYSLVSVKDGSSTACSQTQSGSATVRVNPLPTATVTGTTAVCQNSPRPKITFTGANGTAPYTFTYSLKGTEKTVTTENGNSVNVEVPINEVGTFEYSLVSVKDASTTTCSQVQSGSATVTVNPLPTATVTGTTAVCQNSPRPKITFTGSNGTAPYTFTYILKGTEKAVTTENGNSVSVEVPINEVGTFEYSLVSVKDASTTACSQTQTGSATVTVNPLPTATIAGTTVVCQNSPRPQLTFTGSNGTAPYTFTYILKGTEKAVTTESGNSVNVEVPTNEVGTFEYSLVSVKDGSSTACSQTQSGSATVTVNPLPTATITGTTVVCQNSPRPQITFTGSNGTAPYTFTYILKGTEKTVTTESGNSVSVEAPTNEVGTFEYSLVSVKDASTTTCSQAQSGSATVTVNLLPTATIVGTTAVCQNSSSPKITFTGANGTAPYTFTYSLKGTEKTVTTESGNSVSVEVPTNEVGTFEYSLVSVKDASTTTCSQVQSGSAVVTVNLLPTATIVGTTAVCQNSSSPKITFTGANGTAPYTFTYSLKGTEKTVTTENGNSVSVEVPTNEVGTFEYSLVSVKDASTTTCSQTQTGSATVTVNPLPTATILGTTTVCQNSLSPSITFTGANATAPYTFTYKINDGVAQTVKTASGTSVTVPVLTNTAGTFTYSLVSVSESSSTICSQLQSGSAEIKVQGKPTITLSTLQQTLNEGNSQTFCDIDANPVNSLQFTVSGLCVVGSPVWRVQVGSSSWSDWSSNAPVTQLSNNQPHRYQAACDANCASTYSGVIELTINNRATVPQNVSLSVDGVTVSVGEGKEVCSLVTIPLTFNANCAAGEVTLYSVDGGEYSSGVPTGLVDNQYHNYRVRCRKSDGTPSCVESESGVMRLKLVTIPSAPTVSLSSTSSCDATASFSGQASCGSFRTVWYNATTNVALPNLPSVVPSQTTSYYARCQTENGCVSERSNVVTFTLTPTQVAPIITASQEIVCTGTSVTISANCPAGSQTFWNTGVTTPSFEVSFNNVTKQTYWAKCLFAGGCQSSESIRKDIYWNAFVVTLINVGESKSSVKVNDRAAWTSQFIKRDGGPELEQSTQQNPTLYFVENANKIAPRYWTINVEACGLSTDGSLTFDMLATPEMGVIRSFNTHENNAPYFMYANREGWTELYAQNHPAYGFYQDNGTGGNVYDLGLPKGLYKLGVRYWDQKGWGSIYPSTRKPQGNVLAYQEYWFRIQSKDGVGVGAARTASSQQVATDLSSRRDLLPNVFAQVMPNPVSSVLRLQVQGSKGQKVNATLLDATGREILLRNLVPETNAHQEEFEVSELPTGMYFLQVISATQHAILKVLKVK